MKKILLTVFAVSLFSFGLSGSAKADGCYICSGGSYVKFSGSDTQEKRKKAKACGCNIGGTRGSCNAANLKILCSVKKEQKEAFKLAMKMGKSN